MIMSYNQYLELILASGLQPSIPNQAQLDTIMAVLKASQGLSVGLNESLPPETLKAAGSLKNSLFNGGVYYIGYPYVFACVGVTTTVLVFLSVLPFVLPYL